MNVGTRIKKYINDHGITQSFVSEKAEISKDKLNLALNGKRKFTLDEYVRICGALDVRADFFLTPKIVAEDIA